MADPLLMIMITLAVVGEFDGAFQCVLLPLR